MNELVIRAVIAGVGFGLWPLVMNRSGLAGNVSAAAFSLIVFLCVMPIALMSDWSTIKTANWYFTVGAAVLSGSALIAFNGMLSKATLQEVGMLYLVVLMVEITLPAIYHVINNGLSPLKALGFGLAVVTAVLLSPLVK